MDETFKYSETVRVPDQEALRMIRILAKDSHRDIGDEVAVLIRQEYARRFSQPNPLITVAEAQAAATPASK